MTESLVTRSTYRQMTLDDWQEAFWELYGTKDSELKMYEMMLQLVVDATRLSESMRKEHFDEALRSLPRVFSWLCNLSKKASCTPHLSDLIPLDTPISAIIWNKYPKICYLCGRARCMCPTLKIDSWTERERNEWNLKVKERLEGARKVKVPPTSLNSWVKMFDDIYGGANAERSPATKVFHFWRKSVSSKWNCERPIKSRMESLFPVAIPKRTRSTLLTSLRTSGRG